MLDEEGKGKVPVRKRKEVDPLGGDNQSMSTEPPGGFEGRSEGKFPSFVWSDGGERDEEGIAVGSMKGNALLSSALRAKCDSTDLAGLGGSTGVTRGSVSMIANEEPFYLNFRSSSA